MTDPASNQVFIVVLHSNVHLTHISFTQRLLGSLPNVIKQPLHPRRKKIRKFTKICNTNAHLYRSTRTYHFTFAISVHPDVIPTSFFWTVELKHQTIRRLYYLVHEAMEALVLIMNTPLQIPVTSWTLYSCFSGIDESDTTRQW